MDVGDFDTPSSVGPLQIQGDGGAFEASSFQNNHSGGLITLPPRCPPPHHPPPPVMISALMIHAPFTHLAFFFYAYLSFISCSPSETLEFAEPCRFALGVLRFEELSALLLTRLLISETIEEEKGTQNVSHLLCTR